MDPETFLLSLSESRECKDSFYKRRSINKENAWLFKFDGTSFRDHPFLRPFKNFIRERLEQEALDIDALIQCMMENSWATYAIETFMPRKQGLSQIEFMARVDQTGTLTPFVDEVNMDLLASIVEMYIFDTFCQSSFDLHDVCEHEIFTYETNQGGLTKVNGASFKNDALIFDGKAYYYNPLLPITKINDLDSVPGFATIITSIPGHYDILYRIDEQLSLPEKEYSDELHLAHEKIRGPQFRFDGSNFKLSKTITVHYDPDSLAKLLVVVKKNNERTDEEFWHVEIETLPAPGKNGNDVITTFLHGLYYPNNDCFIHIDIARNQYNKDIYQQKYADTKNGIPVDMYTSSKDLHYKLWCIQNGHFSKETWYNLAIVSLNEPYQTLLNEILHDEIGAEDEP